MPAFDRLVSQPDPGQKIWRYMDFARFVSLLHSKALFFSQIKIQQDRLEGNPGYTGPPGSDLNRFFRQSYDAPNMPWAYSVISSWHMSDYESSAMWRLYVPNNEGIAVQTTVDKLKQSLLLDDTVLREVKTGKVNYAPAPEPIPGDKDGISYDVYCFFKERFYEHEKEFRILGVAANIAKVNEDRGVYVPVDLSRLIEFVYVDPNAETWFYQLVRSVAGQVYEIPEEKIVRSDLNKHWLFGHSDH